MGDTPTLCSTVELKAIAAIWSLWFPFVSKPVSKKEVAILTGLVDSNHQENIRLLLTNGDRKHKYPKQVTE